MSSGNFEYVHQHYGVPACRGRRVRIYGKPGIIVEDRGHYIGVNFDCDKPGRVSNCHPVDGVEYGALGKIRKVSRGAARYAAYLEVGECYQSFLHYLRCKAYERKEGRA